MKIYNKVVINIFTGEVVEEDSYEYHGAMMWCKGGGGTSTTTHEVDKEYNARMAAISEKQQAQSDEYMDYWRTTYKPYEEKQIEANLSLMPYEVAAQKATLKGIAEIAPMETAYRKDWLNAEMDMIPKRHAVSSAFYEQALEGVDIKGRMDTASADVAQSLKGSEGAMRREGARMGLDPTSGRFAEMSKTGSLERAKATGFARAATRVQGEQENFARLTAGEEMVQRARTTK